MKRLLSVSLLSMVLAASFAFAPKVRFADSWQLYNGQVVSGTAAQIKAIYCPGPNNRVCATQIDGTGLVFRP